MSFVRFCHSLVRFFSAATVLALLMSLPQSGLAAGRTGNVYALTNQSTGNFIRVYRRDAKGMLTFVDSVASGGVGVGTGGDPLASQGALMLSADNRLLFPSTRGATRFRYSPSRETTSLCWTPFPRAALYPLACQSGATCCMCSPTREWVSPDHTDPMGRS